MRRETGSTTAVRTQGVWEAEPSGGAWWKKAKEPTLAQYQQNSNWAGPLRKSENQPRTLLRENCSVGRDKNQARTGEIRNQNQHEKWSSQIQNDKTKNKTTSDFATKIQHDSYTAEVTALPPSF
jgi:hypothetical protein